MSKCCIIFVSNLTLQNPEHGYIAVGEMQNREIGVSHARTPQWNTEGMKI
jgi:hypothetical protein